MGIPRGGGLIGIVQGRGGAVPPFDDAFDALERPPGWRSPPLRPRGVDVAASRNVLVRRLLASDKRALLMLDDDQVLRPSTLTRLLAVLEEGPHKIVCPLILRRHPPFGTVAYATRSNFVGGLPDEIGPLPTDDLRGVLPVAACGAGVMLVDRCVFEAMDDPWFECGRINPERLMEDTTFTLKATQKGFTVGLDCENPVGHATLVTVWPARTTGGRLQVLLETATGETIGVDPAGLGPPLPWAVKPILP